MAVTQAGRIVEQGPGEAVLASSQNEHARTLLVAVQRMHERALS